MNTFTRIIRALLVRLIFMAYSLLCIWRVTFVSDNKYYWLMIISIGFLLIETAILLWLRAGKEFRGVLPSVLFFLSCILPSLWIMCIDESNRKNKFHLVAESQENKIKDYVMSLNPLIKSNDDSSYLSKQSASATSLLNNLLNAAQHNKTIKHVRSNYEAMPLIASNLLLTSTTKTTSTVTSTSLLTTKTFNSGILKKKPSDVSNQLLLDKNVDCCDVNVSYWFKEDSLHNLLIQSLMLILITSRWLITRAELNLNQRSLILIISIATGADTIDFFSYLNMEMVYRNEFLLYTTLLILSLSLVQFVFLHVEDSLNLTRSASNKNGIVNNVTTSSNSNFSASNGSSINNLVTTNDEDDMLKVNKMKHMKKNKNLTFFYKQFSLFKNHLKSSNENEMAAISQLKSKDDENLKDKKLIKFKLPSYNKIKNNTNGHTIINAFPLHKNNATRYFCYLCCCCMKQKDPLFLILLLGLFLHDGSYLAFRIFILSKLGWEATLNQSHTLVFFMVKNLFVIITQIYKVYKVTSEKRQRKFYENYRDFVIAAQHQQHQQQDSFPSPTHHKNRINILGNNYQPNNPGFNSAAIAAAATGGQVPLVPINSFQTYPYTQQQHLFLNQPVYQPPAANPYRFAQIYSDGRELSNNMNDTNNHIPLKNRSLSTLGSVNTTLFCDNNQKKKIGNNTMINTKKQIFDDSSNTYYKNNQQHLYKPTSLGGSFQTTTQQTGQYGNSQFSDSDVQMFYGGNNKDPVQTNIYQYQHYDRNITLCQTPSTNMSAAHLFRNNSSNIKQQFYNLPFMNRSRSSSTLETSNARENAGVYTKNEQHYNYNAFNNVYDTATLNAENNYASVATPYNNRSNIVNQYNRSASQTCANTANRLKASKI